MTEPSLLRPVVNPLHHTYRGVAYGDALYNVRASPRPATLHDHELSRETLNINAKPALTRNLSDGVPTCRQAPIAILRAKIEAAQDSTFARRLQGDVARLATLAEQMLDLQRIGRASPLDDEVDLGKVVREVVADLAPLAIAGGKELAVADLSSVAVRGDTAAIGRVLANLIQNALEHGGRQVIVRVEGTTVEVEDDGPGIPLEERERVFDAFHRLRGGNNGAGLGLNLVREVMMRHGGSVEPLEAPSGGTIMRLEFVAGAES